MSLEEDLRNRARKAIDDTFGLLVEDAARKLAVKILEERPVIGDLMALYVETALRKALEELGVHLSGQVSP